MNLNSKWIPDPTKSGFSAWSIYTLLPQLTSILIVTIVLSVLMFNYNRALKKTKVDEAPRGLVLFAEISIKWAERQVTELLGVRYKYLTVYFMYLLLYLGVGNLFSIIGFDSLVTAYTVPFTLGLVALFGIYYFGFKFQRLAYFKKYLNNPLEIIQQFVPLISMTFRLFGNILGGTIILLLLSTLLNNIWGKIPYIGAVDLLAGVIMPFLLIYFDLFDGLIQAFIFTILTFAYWSLEIAHGSERPEKKRKVVSVEQDLSRSRTKDILEEYNRQQKLLENTAVVTR